MPLIHPPHKPGLLVRYFRGDENVGILSPLAPILIVGVMDIQFDDGPGIKI